MHMIGEHLYLPLPRFKCVCVDMESPEADKAGNNLSCMEAIRMMNAVKKRVLSAPVPFIKTSKTNEVSLIASS